MQWMPGMWAAVLDEVTLTLMLQQEQHSPRHPEDPSVAINQAMQFLERVKCHRVTSWGKYPAIKSNIAAIVGNPTWYAL